MINNQQTNPEAKMIQAFNHKGTDSWIIRNKEGNTYVGKEAHDTMFRVYEELRKNDLPASTYNFDTVLFGLLCKSPLWEDKTNDCYLLK